jgi:hypothetical protein
MVIKLSNGTFYIEVGDITDRFESGKSHPTIYSIAVLRISMTTFDPEKFEEKYVHYFDELQEAYKNAYQYMHDRHDSDLLRSIDRQVLDESEPFYEGDGEFRVELPDNPRDRVQNVSIDDEKFDATLQEFVERIEIELSQVFGFEAEE